MLAAFAPMRTTMRATPVVAMQTKEELAVALNPAVGYYDPLGLAEADFWSQGNEATYGFLRQAELAAQSGCASSEASLPR